MIAVDAYEIFTRAREYWDTQRYVPRLNYVTVVEVYDKTRGDRIERYNSAYDAETNTVWIDPVSDYELAHPATGRGIGFDLGRGHQPAPDQDFIGVPMLAPNYSFTLGHHAPVALDRESSEEIISDIRKTFHDPKPLVTPSETPSGLPEITTVEANRHDYRISLAGEELIDNVSCYHLSLVPLHVDGRYRLRDLWIDESNYATVRAKLALNFVDGPGTMIPWTIDFGDEDGSRYIARERADAPYKYAKRSYDRVEIRFEDLAPRTAPMPITAVRVSAFLILVEPP